MAKDIKESVYDLRSDINWAEENIAGAMFIAREIKDKELITKLEGIQTSMIGVKNYLRSKISSENG